VCCCEDTCDTAFFLKTCEVFNPYEIATRQQLDRIVPESISVDIVFLFHHAQPINYGYCWKYWTTVVDLTQSSEELYGRFSTNYRNEIAKSEREDQARVYWLHPNSVEEIIELLELCDKWAVNSGSPRFDFARASAFAQDKQLILSYIEFTGQVCCIHVYWLDDNWIGLYFSKSMHENLVSKKIVARLNKRLHYVDMMEAQKVGCEYYDFLGCMQETNDEKVKSIAAFKRRFGGDLVCNYCTLVPRSFKGWLALQLYKNKKWFLFIRKLIIDKQ